MDDYDQRNDLYVVLGVQDGATGEEIKRIYHEKVQLAHPDGHRQPDLATREMQRLNGAYNVLGDPRRRRAYDEKRAAHRLAQMQPEIQSRLAELRRHAEAQRSAPTSVPTSRAVRRTTQVRKTVPVSRPATPPKQVAPTRGIFETLAQPWSQKLAGEDNPVGAGIVEIGSVVLDGWLRFLSQPQRRTTKRAAKSRSPGKRR